MPGVITDNTAPRQAAGERPRTDLSDATERLQQLARRTSSVDRFYRQALRLVMQRLGAVCGSLKISLTSGEITQHCVPEGVDRSEWLRVAEAMTLAVRVDGAARARFLGNSDTTTGEGRRTVLAVAVGQSHSLGDGVLVLMTSCPDSAAAARQLEELRLIVSLVDALAALVAQREQAPSARAPGIRSAVQAGSFQSFQEFAFALVNNLKNKLGCERVYLGRFRKNRISVASISGFDQLYPRSRSVHRVAQAMEECADHGERIRHPTESRSGRESRPDFRLHRRWRESLGDASVASIPLKYEDRCVGVVSLTNGPDRRFSDEQLEKAEQLLQPLVPAMLLLERADRGLGTHLLEAVRGAGTSLLRRGGWGRKVTLVAAMALAVWCIWGTQPYHVTVPCEIVPARTHSIAAPFQGTLVAARFVPGERVAAGTVLARLDTRELETERRRIRSEREIARLELTQAVREQRLAEAAQARARITMANSRIAAIDWKIERATIRAPTAGTILHGELRSRVGEVVSLGEPLFEFAADGDWRVKLHLPEFAVSHLAGQERGVFTLQARPDQPHGLQVVHIESSARIVDGRTVIVAEGKVEGRPPEWIRAGMRGVARVDAGRHPVWWVYGHGILDRIRYQWWRR